jgi:hypothetical protein
MSARGFVLAILAAVMVLEACDPFGLPATRALESGVADMLDSAHSFEITGTYVQPAQGPWTIDLQLVRPNARHVVLIHQSVQLEAIIIGADGYFRGKQFMAARMIENPSAPGLVEAAGNAWWKDSVSLVPSLPDFTGGAAFRATFLGSAVSARTDHQQVDGVDAVELSGARADVFIATAAPYHLLRVHLKAGVEVDGLLDADLSFKNVDRDFGIAAPRDVIDFANLSTLPPVYSVLSVDTSQCGTPCVVSARLKNLGGLTGARAPSAVVFTMKDPTSGQALGSCRATVQPDVGYNATTTVSCTLNVQPVNGAVVTAAVDNPGRA